MIIKKGLKCIQILKQLFIKFFIEPKIHKLLTVRLGTPFICLTLAVPLSIILNSAKEKKYIHNDDKHYNWNHKSVLTQV